MVLSRNGGTSYLNPEIPMAGGFDTQCANPWSIINFPFNFAVLAYLSLFTVSHTNKISGWVILVYMHSYMDACMYKCMYVRVYVCTDG